MKSIQNFVALVVYFISNSSRLVKLFSCLRTCKRLYIVVLHLKIQCLVTMTEGSWKEEGKVAIARRML